MERICTFMGGAQNYKYMGNKCQKGKLKKRLEQDYKINQMLDAQLIEKISVLVKEKEVQTKDLESFSKLEN